MQGQMKVKQGRMKIKVKDGKLDLESLEQGIKKILPGYTDFKFNYSGNKVSVTARGDKTPEGKVELFMFIYYL